MKFVKKYFIKRRNLNDSKLLLARSYPKSFKKIGIISKSGFVPDTNFITKLKNGFGGKVQIFTFVIDYVEDGGRDFHKIGLNDFSFFGKFNNNSLFENFKELDILIDMTLESSFLKSFILIHSSQAYKICLGKVFSKFYNLSINLKTPDQDLFADEIIKYHNILGNG
jgi:hypothetical protein